MINRFSCKKCGAINDLEEESKKTASKGKSITGWIGPAVMVGGIAFGGYELTQKNVNPYPTKEVYNFVTKCESMIPGNSTNKLAVCTCTMDTAIHKMSFEQYSKDEKEVSDSINNWMYLCIKMHPI